MAAKNQCDGCRAGYPGIKRDGVTYHMMGPKIKLGIRGCDYAWQDMMICERDKYGREQDGKL